MTFHVPIMCKEILEYLAPQSGDIILDGTLGGGGHTQALLASCPDITRVVGMDRDEEAITHLKALLPTDKLTTIRGNFSDFSQLLKDHRIVGVNKVILDLGISSHQIDVAQRGFSYQHEGPLDMRMDTSSSLDMTAEKILQDYSEKALTRVFKEYGEEPASAAIAREIVQRRQSHPLQTTLQLAELIRWFIRGGYSRKMMAVKRIFQAIRIEVNGELVTLRKSLLDLAGSLPSQGRMVVLTFHSLEDRIVKQTFQELSLAEPSVEEQSIVKLTKKAIRPSREEIRVNKRSTSAKLRAIFRR